MKKIKLLLTLLTIIITIAPIGLGLLFYRDNLIGAVVPPEIVDIMGDVFNNVEGIGDVDSNFGLPKLVGAPQYNPETKTLIFTINFTNPLDTQLTVNKLEAGVVSHNDGVFLGNISIDEPLSLNPKETKEITIQGVLSDEAINYLETKSINQNSINIDLVNLTADVAGVTVEIDEQNIGNLPIPPQLFE